MSLFCEHHGDEIQARRLRGGGETRSVNISFSSLKATGEYDNDAATTIATAQMHWFIGQMSLTTVEFSSIGDEHRQWGWAARYTRNSKNIIARILTDFQVIFV